jgi:hypothetical protein
VPVTSSAAVAGLVTLLAGAAIGLPGYLHHLGVNASAVNRVVIDAAASGKHPELDNEGSLRRVGSSFGSLSLVTFFFFTTTGWITMYLTLSGLVRAVAGHLDDPRGDFVLSGVDALVHGIVQRTRQQHSARTREALEGPEVPDRAVAGVDIGMPGCDIVVIASRVKPDWDRGTAVLTQDGEFRVKVVEERTVDGRLRTLYGLDVHRDQEVFRRMVRYTLPSAAKRP